MGLIAVLATFLLVVVAARATGETDITPVGPLSKITQLTFGAHRARQRTDEPDDREHHRRRASASAGDLLTDLKSGYLLGAKPRQQFLAQFFGVLAGGLVDRAGVLHPDSGCLDLLGTEKWPAPAALVWRGVAELLSKGVGALPPSARCGHRDRRARSASSCRCSSWRCPSRRSSSRRPPASAWRSRSTASTRSRCSSARCSAIMAHAPLAPRQAQEYTVPVSSGIIAGESLMGVAIALLTIAVP